MNQKEIFKAIVEERIRQDYLHSNNKKSDYPAILMEEFGEIGAALQGDGVLIDELIQLAAVCIRWIEEL